MVTRLLDLLLGRGSKFYPFERGILENVKSELDTEAGFLFQRQIDAVNKVQRLTDGKEVNLYQIVDGRPVFDESLCFPNMPGEVLLATVKLTSDQKRSELKSDVWLVEGRLFSLEFSQSPKHFFAGVSFKDARPTDFDVVVWPDLLKLR